MEVTREELLIARVVERAESPEDWEELCHLARADAALWARLHDGMRDDASLRAAVAAHVSLAESVDVRGPRRSGVPWTASSGWLAAAALALAWLFAGGDGGGAGGAVGPNGASPPGGDADAAKHLAAGKGLGELPRVLIEAQPTADGRGLRVVSMRRILEESFVQQVYEVGKDERGEERPIRVDLAHFTAPSDF